MISKAKIFCVSVLAVVGAGAISVPALASGADTVFSPIAEACQVAGDELVMVLNGQRTVMRYANPQVRTAARGMGFGGVGQYAALPGPSAMARLPNGAQPTFILAAPSNMQPQGMYTLARLERRRNNTREVSIGGGYMSYSTGVPADRQIPLDARQAASQAGAPAGATLYELTVTTPLASGEYAMIVSTGQGQTNMPMAGMTGRFYDFGVD